MSEKKNFFTARNIALLAILVAVTIVLQLFASSIPLPGGKALNFSLIPIALAAIVLGPLSGALMGFICGFIIFVSAALMGGEPFTALQFEISPIVLTLVCIGKTTVAGLACGYIHRALNKVNKVASIFVASFAVPVINTTIYVIGCLLIKDALIEAFALDSAVSFGALFALVITTIWINFVLEIVITAVLTPAVKTVVSVVENKWRNK